MLVQKMSFIFRFKEFKHIYVFSVKHFFLWNVNMKFGILLCFFKNDPPIIGLFLEYMLQLFFIMLNFRKNKFIERYKLINEKH